MKKIILTLSLFTTVSSQTILEVHNELNKLNVQHSEIVTAQIVLECGWSIDSYNATVRNNLLGWTINGQLATFNHWSTCLRHYKVWQSKYYRGGCYFDFLECINFGDGKCHRYAADVQYVSKLKSILKNLKGC
jgi:hypothetical protein